MLLGFSAEAGVVVQVEHIEPGDYIVPVGSDVFNHAAHVFSAFDVGWGSLHLVFRPLIEFEIGSFCVVADPGQDFGIRFSILQ
jgi:hypothetical protein